MRKAVLFVLFLLLAANASAFAPDKVKSIDVSVQLKAIGTIEGDIGEGDLMTVSMLTFSDTLDKEVKDIDEKLIIGGEIFRPRYEIDNGNTYAVFDVSDLHRFRDSRDFTVEINANIVTRPSVGIEKDFSIPVEVQPSLKKFLWKSDFIETDDSELKLKAEMEFESDSGIEVVRKVTEWINRNIEYDYDYYNGTWSAKETYLNRRGVCDEFANLTAAFLRIKGIPAKYISGISFDGKKFGNHGWVEVLAGDEWIGVDSTYGEAGYLDGTHISLAKEVDANATENLIITLRSRRPISVSTQLMEPAVEINSVEFFEGITSMEVFAPETLYLNQLFDINAVIENKTGKHILYPLRLSMHKDFGVNGKKKVVWLGPGERKTVSWQIYAPLEGKAGFKKQYYFSLQGMDQNFSGGIEVLPYSAGQEVKASIEVEKVIPSLEGDELVIKVVLYNHGLEDGNVSVEINYAEGLAEYNESVPGKRKKTFSYSFRNLLPRTLHLKVGTEPPQIYRIVLGEDNSVEVFSSGGMPPEPEPKPWIEEMLGEQWLAFIAIGLIVGLISMLIVQRLFFMKRAH